MKIRSIVALAGLTISFAMPAFAEEKEEVNSFLLSPELLIRRPTLIPGREHCRGVM
jgi:hypothetical protein